MAHTEKMSVLFDTDQSIIVRHIENICETGELEQVSTMQKMHTAQSTKPVQHHNLDIIISVGYRVNSYRGPRFRMWATKKLREFIIKGYVIDDSPGP